MAVQKSLFFYIDSHVSNCLQLALSLRERQMFVLEIEQQSNSLICDIEIVISEGSSQLCFLN